MAEDSIGFKRIFYGDPVGTSFAENYYNRLSKVGIDLGVPAAFPPMFPGGPVVYGADGGQLWHGYHERQEVLPFLRGYKLEAFETWPREDVPDDWQLREGTKPSYIVFDSNLKSYFITQNVQLCPQVKNTAYVHDKTTKVYNYLQVLYERKLYNGDQVVHEGYWDDDAAQWLSNPKWDFVAAADIQGIVATEKAGALYIVQRQLEGLSQASRPYQSELRSESETVRLDNLEAPTGFGIAMAWSNTFTGQAWAESNRGNDTLMILFEASTIGGEPSKKLYMAFSNYVNGEMKITLKDATSLGAYRKANQAWYIEDYVVLPVTVGSNGNFIRKETNDVPWWQIGGESWYYPNYYGRAEQIGLCVV